MTSAVAYAQDPSDVIGTAAQLAQRLVESRDEAAKTAALIAIFDVLSIGVYKTDGTLILRGAEQDVADFYLYEPELITLTSSLLRGESDTIERLAARLGPAGIRAEDNSTFDTSTVFAAIRGAVEAALSEPKLTDSLIPALVREIGLRSVKPYDLRTETDVDNVSLDALQQFLIVADLSLSLMKQYRPVSPVFWPDRTGNTSSLALTRSLSRLSDFNYPEHGSGLRGVQPHSGVGVACDQLQAELGKVIKKLWPVGKVAISLSAASKKGLKSALALYPVLLEALNGIALTYSTKVEPVVDTLDGHYGHEAEATPMLFQVKVTMLDSYPESLVKCGWLSGVDFPEKGSIAGIPIDWSGATSSNLAANGTFDCGADCTQTGADGVATLKFTPFRERNPFQGPLVIASGPAFATADVLGGLSNNFIGALPYFLFPRRALFSWSVGRHDQGGWQGTVRFQQFGMLSIPVSAPAIGDGLELVRADFRFDINSGTEVDDGLFVLQGRFSGELELSNTVETYFSALSTCDQGGQAPFSLRTVYDASMRGQKNSSTDMDLVQLRILGDNTYRITVYPQPVTVKGSERNLLIVSDGCGDGRGGSNQSRVTALGPTDIQLTPASFQGQGDLRKFDKFSDFGRMNQDFAGVPTAISVTWDLSHAPLGVQ
jgi:hypothetical protein